MDVQNTALTDLPEEGPINIVGDTIRRLRRKRNMSQQDLSIKLETMAVYVCRGSISRIEDKSRKVSDKELRAFSKIFGVPMEELIDEGY